MKPLAPQPPSLDELRRLWANREPSIDDLRRLIREVQHARLQLDKVRELLDKHDRELRKRGLDDLRCRTSPFRMAEALLLAEIRRVGTIDDAPKRATPGSHAERGQNIHLAPE
ncbi:hypothetical protein BG58_22760 [Caballeronia jiangsuensis]|nr:hypothetical protein BG58_22760 [Caballeronia jiangsuensis]